MGLSSDSIYGIRLNLENVGQSLRTPDELRKEKERLEKQYSELGNEIFTISESSAEEISRITTKRTEALAPLRQRHTLLKVEAEKIPITRQNLQNERHSLEMEEQDIISKELKALSEQMDQFKRNLDMDTEKRLLEFDRQIKLLDDQMKAELSGKGIDIAILDKYRTSIDNLKERISQIESDRTIVTEYKVAEKDLFSIEPNIRREIKHLDSQLKSLKIKYDGKSEKISQKLYELNKETESVRKELDLKHEGLEEYRQVVENEHLVM